MSNGYVYLILILVIFMALVRFIFPVLIYLLPVILVFYFIRMIFRPRRKTTSTTYQQTYYDNQQTTHQQNQSSDPNVIDVDYKVVDEQEQDNTQ